MSPEARFISLSGQACNVGFPTTDLFYRSNQSADWYSLLIGTCLSVGFGNFHCIPGLPSISAAQYAHIVIIHGFIQNSS